MVFDMKQAYRFVANFRPVGRFNRWLGAAPALQLRGRCEAGTSAD